MSPPLAATLVFVALLCGLAYATGLAVGKRGEPLRDWVALRTRHRHDPITTESRPIEEIAADLRRLGGRFHSLDPRTSFTKVEAVRCGYDRALAECCAALGLTHLLSLIPAGAELDVERERVEGLLTDSGVRLPHVV